MLLDDSGNAVLTDFGLALHAGQAGAPGFRDVFVQAPETLASHGKFYSTYTDMWSFGLLMWEVIACKPDGDPYEGQQSDDDIDDGMPRVQSGAVRPRLPASSPLPRDLMDVIEKRCLAHDPAERWSAKQVYDAFENAMLPTKDTHGDKPRSV